jgi:hypothetical protein
MWSSALFWWANSKPFSRANMLAGPNFIAMSIRLNISLLPFFCLLVRFCGSRFPARKVSKLGAAEKIPA